MRTLLLSVLLGAGCSGTCGTSSYYLYGGERWVMYEDCSYYGSFGRHFPDVGYTSIFLSPDAGDIDAYADFVYALTPGTELVFLTEHLEVGRVLDTRHLGGTGFHDPTASGALPTIQDFSGGTLAIVDGPRDGFAGTQEWRLAWDVSVGPEGDEYGAGYQHHVGEDWVSLDQSLWVWEDGEHGGARPPDAP